MAQKVIKVRNKVKYDTEANWAKSDPVLLAGELAVSSDRNNRIKVGDGTNKWSALSFSGLKVGSNITLADDTISITKSNVTSALGYTPPTTNTTYNDATQSARGLMTAADKKKLDGIASGANAYSHPSATAYTSGLYKITTNNLGHVTAATAVTKSDITALGIPGQDTNTTYNDVTQSAHGLMTAADKKKLDGIASGANKITVDSSMSTSSTNPVQNKVVKAELDKKMNIEATALTNEDLNKITTYGFYYGGGSNSVTNKPAGIDAFGLHVYRSAGGYIIQELTGGNINERSKYIRQYAAGGVWTSWTTEAIFSNTPVDGRIVVTDGTEGKVKSSSYTIASSVPANAKFTDTVYTHPSYTAKESGLYKVTVDNKGHVSAATAVTKGDITALGIPSANTDTHYTTGLKVGASATATANAAATNGNVFLNAMDNTTIRDSHKIVGSGATSVTSDASGNITISSSNTTYNDATQSAHGLMTAADKKKLDGIASGANAYTHPSATAYASGLYKITTNALGHVTAATAVTKSDITALGIPGQDTNTVYTHPSYTAKESGLYKVTVDNKGHVSAATAVTKSDITALGIPGQDTNTTYTVGTESYSGTTKLYGSTGTSTDGTMTRNAITNALNGKANSSHTHNYAGSSSAGGNANAALKLATARSVAANTDFAMSFSFDGSKDVSAQLSYYNCTASNGNKNNYPYHRFARIDKVTASYNDRASTFLITQDYQGGGWGIVSLRLRTNNTTQASDVQVIWLLRHNLSVDCVQVAIDTTSGATYADAFIKLAGTYNGTVIRNLASGSRGNISRTWTLNSSREVDNTTTSDALTSTESYVDIATAGTKLHNKAYTKTVTAVDVATVSYANSAGTASNVKDSGNNTVTTLAYSKAGLDSASWFAAWNNYELRAISPANALKAMGGASTSVATQSANGLLSASDKKKLDGIASGANAYSHPTATAYASGLYKITTNNLGHVTSATAVTKSDITALGIPGQDTNTVYTHPGYTSKSSGLYKITVDGTGHVSAASAVTKADITGLGIPGQDTNTHYKTSMSVGKTNSDNSNAAATNGNVFLKIFDDSEFRAGCVIKGTGATTVTSASDGTISINSTNTVYTHPSYTAKASGLYKVTVDDKGHVSATAAVTKSDITALGIPGQDTNTTYNDATQSNHGLMSTSDKKKLDNISSNSQNTVYSSSQPSGQAIGDYWVKLEG